MWDSVRINAHVATLREGKYSITRRSALAADHGRGEGLSRACSVTASHYATIRNSVAFAIGRT
jgi:hypothetical protein